jgi:hypothetical protein|tara:strand:+ start:1337 stop:2605 length:1269 start_codon:yes stop_codon:yes gene_type:complete
LRKNTEITNKVTKRCADAMSFLTEKGTLIEERLASIQKAEHTIENSNFTEEEKKEKYSELEKLEDELYLFEVNESDLMVEHLFMCDISNELNKLIGNKGISYEDNDSYLKAKKSILTTRNKDLEDSFSKIKGETPDKIVARKGVVDSEKALERFNNEYLSFEGNYGTLSASILEKDKEIEKEVSVLEDMEGKLKADQLEYEDAFLNFKATHREVVDARSVVNSEKRKQEDVSSANELYQTHNHELLDINKKLSSIEEDLKGVSDSEKDEQEKVNKLNRELGVYEGKIMIQEELVSKLGSEREWLRKQTKGSNAKINTLEDKLSTWKINYKEFESLVDSIETKVGYPTKKLSFDGEDSEVNPLRSLISRVESINKWIEENEPLKPIDDTPPKPTPEPVAQNVISPYLVGVLALGGLAVLTMRK